MAGGVPHLSPNVARRTILAVGGAFVLLSVGQSFRHVFAGESILDIISALLLVGVPGLLIFYVGYILEETSITRETYPRILTWASGGFGVLLAVVGTLILAPGFSINNAGWSAVLATAIGTVAGTAIGFNEARAFSRAHEAEEAGQELEQTVERLEESNQRLEQFAYAASHDLQEPLRMVSSYLQLLESRYADDLDEDAKEFIGFAVDGSDRMRAMIESLLEYSRVTSEGEPFAPTEVEDILDDVLKDLRPRIEETEATVTADDLPTVAADATQLGQVLQNLLSNALTYSGEEPPRVHVSAKQTDGSWRFSVSDEGIGIAPEYHERIFKTFERLDTDRGIDGTGIGLALCERIIERHNGEMWVESTRGEGATFYFTISIEQTGPEPQSVTQPSL